MFEILPFDLEKHIEAVYNLWQVTSGQTWLLDQETFTCLLGDLSDNAYPIKHPFVAFVDDSLVGFVITQISKANSKAISRGNVILLLVSPQYQKQGIGSALHKYIIYDFQQAGVKNVQLGGGSPSFWQGIPLELVGSVAFFSKMGWEFLETSYDLIQDLQGNNNSPAFIRPIEITGVSFRLTDLADKDALIAFQKEEFPRWLKNYEYIMELGDYNDILVACNPDGEILGMLILYSKSSSSQRLDNQWKKELGENAGAIGCVGISKAMQGKGTGSALVAFANDILKGRGVGICLIGWTWRVTFYNRLGFQLWKSYKMSQRSLF